MSSIVHDLKCFFVILNKENQFLDNIVYLLWYSLGCLSGVVALIDYITNFLAVHNEVNAICGQNQEGVVDMMQLLKKFKIWFIFTILHLHDGRQAKADPPCFCLTHWYSFGLRLSDDPHVPQVKVSDTACHRQPTVDVGLSQTVPGDETSTPFNPSGQWKCREKK